MRQGERSIEVLRPFIHSFQCTKYLTHIFRFHIYATLRDRSIYVIDSPVWLYSSNLKYVFWIENEKRWTKYWSFTASYTLIPTLEISHTPIPISYIYATLRDCSIDFQSSETCTLWEGTWQVTWPVMTDIGGVALKRTVPCDQQSLVGDKPLRSPWCKHQSQCDCDGWSERIQQTEDCSTKIPANLGSHWPTAGINFG